MNRDCVLRATLACALMTPVASPAADEYWSYSYRDIDVTAEGTSAYAINLARYCVRLDGLLTRVLGIKSTDRTPMHIYALPSAQVRQLLGDSARVSYRISGNGNTVIMANTAARDSDYWGAYFGYTAALLASDGRLKGPDWYMTGVPQVFAGTVYKGSRAQLGVVELGYAVTLGQGSALIPLRTFLAQRKREVVGDDGHRRELYEAQSWALAHEIYVEGWHRAEFTRYLDLMRQGTSEAAAFSACFKVSYEQLDKEFALAIHQRPYVYTLEVPEDSAARGETAQPLSAAEFKDRVLLLAQRIHDGPDAERTQ
jgi:hypothetical protein